MNKPITYYFKANIKDDIWKEITKDGKIVQVTTEKGEWAAFYWFREHFPVTADAYIPHTTLKAIPLPEKQQNTEFEKCPICGKQITMHYCPDCEEGIYNGE